MAFVTLAQVNSALRLDLQGASPTFSGDERTADVELKIKQAEDIVLDYITQQPEEPWTSETVPGRVSAAVMLVIKALLDDPEGEMLAGLAGGDLRNPVVALLYRLRDPTLA